MACENCTVLRDRVERLERELGVRRRDGAVAAIMTRLELSPSQSALLLLMYESAGRVLRERHLLEGTGIGSPSSLTTTISYINKKLGGEVIHNTWGVGYALTPKGVSLVFAAIEPPEIQREVVA